MENKLEELYRQINQKGISALTDHKEVIDDYLSSPKLDFRRGLTLLVPIPAHIRRNIMFCMQKLKNIEPNEYYYPAEDLHIIAIDILAARPDFTLSPLMTSKYCNEIIRLAAKVGPIHWTIKGLIASPGAVLVKGYYSANLTKLRNLIRRSLPANGLKLDERYPTYSGHMTIARFSHPIVEQQQFLQTLAELDNIELGTFTTSNLDLVIHDWYNHDSQVISSIPLAGN